MQSVGYLVLTTFHTPQENKNQLSIRKTGKHTRNLTKDYVGMEIVNESNILSCLLQLFCTFNKPICIMYIRFATTTLFANVRTLLIDEIYADLFLIQYHEVCMHQQLELRFDFIENSAKT